MTALPAVNPAARARAIAALVLLTLGLWTLHDFLRPLAWAVVTALATWPLLQRLDSALGARRARAWGPVLLTGVGGLLVMVPVTFGIVRAAQEAQSVMQLLQNAKDHGLPAPDWLARLPAIGEWLRGQWNAQLGTSEAAREALHALLSGEALGATREIAANLLHRYTAVFFTLLALFFIYREGAAIGSKVLDHCAKVFGEDGRRYALHAVTAVRATVNGIVLVAVGEGVFLGFGYGFAGIPHPALLGVLTGVAAFVPFAAKLVLGGTCLILFATDQVGAGAGLLAYGLVIVLIAENYLRPAFIGGAVALPFLWTLFGILGGVQTFGLLGLFIGPTVMAVLVSIWRDLADTGSEPENEVPQPRAVLLEQQGH